MHEEKNEHILHVTEKTDPCTVKKTNKLIIQDHAN